ncbi:MAG: SMI1/KNR4 family protein [Bdellovibrionales bacterium]|nr:SMI1/KNR4 family protein [Bdellovibrionales bacterium]
MSKFIPKALGRTLNIVDFADADDLLGTPIPDELKEFLLENNGGTPTKTEFVTEDEGIDGDIKFFLPLDDGAEETIMDEIEHTTLEGLLPKHIIPIAVTTDENRIVISCRKDDFGMIYYWAADEQGDDRPSYDFLHIIAEDLQTFIDSLG